VEFDPASQWYNASITITAAWLKTGGKVDYDVFAQPPDDIRVQLIRLGLEPEKFEREEKLTITDWYTATLGQKSKEKHSHDTLRFHELSIYFAKTHMRGEPETDKLYITDDESTFTRFNDEKAWVELELTRIIPALKMRKATNFITIMKDVHSEWVYKRLEAAVDGIIDFKVEDTGQERRDVIGIRTMRNVGFDRRWHPLSIAENFEITVKK